MPIDVETDIEFDRPREVVAAYVAHPGNAPEWYENIERVEWRTEPSLAVVDDGITAPYVTPE